MAVSDPIPFTQQVQEAAEFVLRKLGGEAGSDGPVRPVVGIVLGSGLGAVAAAVKNAQVVPFEEIPHFPQVSVEGHAGQLIVGDLAGQRVAVLSGRSHCYEGYTMSQVCLPVQVLHPLGCRTLILTCAGGGLNPYFWPGDLMLIHDHINLPGLVGIGLPAGDGQAWGPRFVDLTDAYDPQLGELAMDIARGAGITLRRGVYTMVAGPNYETPAGRLWLQSLGADAVGMSTVPEVVAARQLGMRVLAIACITNLAFGPKRAPADHQKVLAQAEQAAPRLGSLIEGVLRALPR